jgi:hypothetical protein
VNASNASPAVDPGAVPLNPSKAFPRPHSVLRFAPLTPSVKYQGVDSKVPYSKALLRTPQPVSGKSIATMASEPFLPA